jgi:hypothetical protein
VSARVGFLSVRELGCLSFSHCDSAAMSATPIIVTEKDVKRGACHYLTLAVMILVGTPVLYLLSLGIAVLIWGKFRLELSSPALTSIYVAVYSPVSDFAMTDTKTGELVRMYIHFWNPNISAELPPGVPRRVDRTN